jgi:hypothetical protein
MITVSNFLHKYCELKKLLPPTKEDLERCGRMINHHFRHYWAIHEYEGVVQDCGFIVDIEDGKKITVIAYPDIFKNEMAKRIDVYYLLKSQPKQVQVISIEQPLPTPELTSKKRKRIPPKPTKEISVKPTNHLGQIQGQ